MRVFVAASVIGLAAFISLSYEILWYRMLAFVSGDPASIFGLLLAFYLAGVAGGALGVASACRRLGPRPAGRPWLGIAMFIGLANLFGYAVGPLLGWLAQSGAWPLVFPVIVLATALLGGVLPLVTHYAVDPDTHAGSMMSRLYAANILGSAVGSLLTGYILLDLLPLRVVALLLALFGFGLACVVVLKSPPRRPANWVCAAAILGSAGVVALVHRQAYEGLYERLLYKERFQPTTRFAHTVENRVGVVTVTERAEVFGGGVYDGMIRTDPVDDRNGILRAYAVGGMHPRPRSILMIGMATGAWAQVLVHTPGLASLTVVEINPGYLDLIAEYDAVKSLLENPKVRILLDDGRRWLRKNPEARFDAIVANATFNWRSHSTNLLSVEFLQLIRRHLAPGGLYYFNTTDSPHAAKTAFTVFPWGLRFRNFVAVSDSPISLDRARWADMLSRWEIDGRPVVDPKREADRARLASIESEADGRNGQSGEVEDRESVLERTRQARLITDDNMATEWEQLLPALWLP